MKIEAPKQVSFASPAPGRELRRDDGGRGRRANARAGCQFLLEGRLEGVRVPRVRKSEHALVLRHYIQDQAGRAVPPAADHPRVARLLEPTFRESIPKLVVVDACGDRTDYVHIVCRSCRRRRRIADPQVDACTPQEDHLVNERSKRSGGRLEQFGTHGCSGEDFRESAVCSSSAATWRTRASPARRESMMARRLESAGLSRLACTAAGCSGRSAWPRTAPSTSGHTGGGSSLCCRTLRAMGSAAQAAGVPRVSSPGAAGAMNRAACASSSSKFALLTCFEVLL